MCIIDTDDKALLILSGVYAPRPTDDTHITLCDSIACDLERAETVLDLAHWVECIRLSTLYCWLSSDIALRQVLICRTEDALPRTSPELREE